MLGAALIVSFDEPPIVLEGVGVAVAVGKYDGETVGSSSDASVPSEPLGGDDTEIVGGDDVSSFSVVEFDETTELGAIDPPPLVVGAGVSVDPEVLGSGVGDGAGVSAVEFEFDEDPEELGAALIVSFDELPVVLEGVGVAVAVGKYDGETVGL
mmetsp:Transcript_6971/g.17257  ORF Transcript_6971/g.17257 Transcript_6971/m.17257 type:complete len:154 (+) Transcript_6971:79-540(+)